MAHPNTSLSPDRVRSLRIGFVVGEYPPDVGGVGDHTARLAREIAALGHTVEVLTSDRAVPASREPVSSKDRVTQQGDSVASRGPTVLRWVRAWDLRTLWRVPRLARDRGWNVVHLQYQSGMYALNGAPNALGVALRAWRLFWRGCGPRLVTTFHDLRVPYLFPKAGPLRRQAVRLLATTSDAVIAVHEDDLEALHDWRAAHTKATTRHVPLGNQLDAPPPDGFEPAAWRDQHGITPGELLVCHAGLVNHSKGLLDLAGAVAALREEGLNVRLVMAGERLGVADPTNRAYHASVAAKIEALGLTPHVTWTGRLPLEEISAWLRTADVVALPFTDGATLRRTSLIAAWGQGAAVVTTEPEGPAAWRTSSPGTEAALYVARGEVPALTAGLRHALADPATRARVANAGRQMAARFDWTDIARQTLAVYEAALTPGT